MNSNIELLQEYSHDTGAFRVSSSESSKLAKACQAALNLFDIARKFDEYVAAQNEDRSLLDREDMWEKLSAALSEMKGEV